MKTTRRHALRVFEGLAALTPAASAATAIAAVAHPDAELLSLDKAIDALLARYDEHDALPEDHEDPAWNTIYAALDAAPDDDPHSMFWNDPQAWHLCVIQDDWRDTYDCIMNSKPATKEGLAVMARAYLLEQDRASHTDDEGEGEKLALAVLSVLGIARPAAQFYDRIYGRTDEA